MGGFVAPTAAFAEDPPVVQAPSDLALTGVATVGETLAVTSSAWVPDTTMVSYVWQADGVEIAGQTADRLALTPDLLDKTVSVVATGTAAGYTSASATAAASSPVGKGAIANAPTPTVSGTVRVGATLTAQPGRWPDGVTLTYEWLRDGVAIDGALSGTYVLVPADLGHALAVRVTGHLPAYEDSVQTSAPTAAVAAGVFTSAPVPTISGTVRVDKTLTANPGAWAPGATFTYQWRANGVVISGATSRTFRLTSTVYGKAISVTVRGTAQGYAAVSRTSAATAPVGLGTFSVAPTPTISGVVEIHRTLTANPGTWSPWASLSYRWRVNGVAISGATARTFTIPSTWAGKRISVTVTAKRSYYQTTSRTSALTAPVTKPFSVAPRPTISGTTRVYSYLKVSVGGWSPAPASFSYQWKRNGVSISGATGGSYRLTDRDYGKTITVTVTARRSGYTTTGRTSYGTAKIGAPAPTLRSDGMYAVGSTIPAGTYYAPGGSACYWERRSMAGSSLAGIIANDFNSGGRNIVTISSTDRYFYTHGCGSWTRLANIWTPGTSAGQGMYKIGLHLKPGLYHASGGSSCYWQRTSGFGGTLQQIIENDYGVSGPYVQILSSDVGFTSWHCGTWTKVG
ncbi:hypothetical protein [Intrasporangium mesophilum]